MPGLIQLAIIMRCLAKAKTRILHFGINKGILNSQKIDHFVSRTCPPFSSISLYFDDIFCIGVTDLTPSYISNVQNAIPILYQFQALIH